MKLKDLAPLAMTLLLPACGCEQVDTGYRGLEFKFGEIQGEPKPEGLYFYNPFTSNIKEIEVREMKMDGIAKSYTKDTQMVDIAVVITFFPEPNAIGKIYKEFGDGWVDKLIPQVVQGSVKDVVGRYIADDLVGKREEARASAETEIRDNLARRHINVTRLDFVNLDFDDGYEKAIEAKVVAVQRAAEAKNQTVQIEEQARQKVISAEAEAKSMQIRSQALSQNKSLVEYEFVQKWNGQLPTIMNGQSGSLINIPQSLLGGK